MSWASGSWTASNSETLVSCADSTRLYSFFTYGSTKYAYLVSFNSTNGNVISSRFKSNISCSSIYGMVEKGNYLLATVLWTSSYLVLVDTTSFTFSIKQSSGTSLYGVAVEQGSGK